MKRSPSRRGPIGALGVLVFTLAGPPMLAAADPVTEPSSSSGHDGSSPTEGLAVRSRAVGPSENPLRAGLSSRTAGAATSIRVDASGPVLGQPRPPATSLAPSASALLLGVGLVLASLLAASRVSPRVALRGGLVGCAAWLIAVTTVEGAAAVAFAPLAMPLLAALAPGTLAALGRFQEEQKARRQIAQSLGAYVNEHVVRTVLEDPTAAGIHGASRRVTVLMVDIVGYSRFAESRPAEEVVAVLNTYFEAMTEVVQRAGGTVDKFIGDGMLAIFGAPLALPRDGAPHAVRAALEMERQLGRLHVRWRSQGLPPLEMGIGVHTGISVVGTMGSSRKMEYTVIGDAVNIAAGIESASRRLGHRILVSDDCFSELDDPPPGEDLGEIVLRGREGAVRLWGLSPREEDRGVRSEAAPAWIDRPGEVDGL